MLRTIYEHFSLEQYDELQKEDLQNRYAHFIFKIHLLEYKLQKVFSARVRFQWCDITIFLFPGTFLSCIGLYQISFNVY